MIKRILITLIIVISSLAVYAQQYTPKNLIGHWREARRKQVNIFFLTDSTGTWVANDGFVYNKMNYTANADKDIIELKFTTQVNTKHPKYSHPQIKFLNDSVFLIRMMWGIPKNADTTNKKVGVFVRVKTEMPGTEMRLPSYKDLLGQWLSTFKKDTGKVKLSFIDSNRVIRKTATSATLMSYITDFTTQPITIDFYVEGKLLNQAFLLFRSRNDLRIQYFDPGKRKEHFTVFGQNNMFTREKHFADYSSGF